MSKSVKVHGRTSTKTMYTKIPSNPRLMYLRSSTKFLSETEQKRKRRRVKSNIVRKSRKFSSMVSTSLARLSPRFSKNGASIKESIKEATLAEKRGKTLEEISNLVLEDMPDSRILTPTGKSDSVQRKDTTEDVIYSLSAGEYDKVSIILPSPDSGADYSEGLTLALGKKLSDILESSEEDNKQEYSDDDLELICAEEDDDTLPPYYQIIPEMFYKFAGVSQYSDTNQLQSSHDFEKLLKCLDLDSLLEDFLFWFPKPKLVKPGNGYISLDMFCDLFCSKFAQTILESRWQYETLCSAILTMKCLDQKKLNRIEFEQFLGLYRSLYFGDVEEEDVMNIFKKYDTNGIGFLTIVNIFKFCCDEEDAAD